MSQDDNMGLVGKFYFNYFCRFLGAVFLFGSIILLFKSEKKVLEGYLTKEFVKKNYVEASADTIDKDKEDKLVFVRGNAVSEDSVVDNVFNVKVDNSLSINRVVEMYQWKETSHKHTSGSGKKRRIHYTYSYSTGWYPYVIDSFVFHEKKNHENPSIMYHNNLVVASKKIKVGVYNVNSSGFARIGAPEKIDIDETTIKLPDSAIIKDNKIYYNTYVETKNRKEKVNESHGIINEDIKNFVANEKLKYDEKKPKIGDVRITFSRYPVCDVSVLAKQSGDRLIPYKTQNQDIYIIRYGKVSIDNMINSKWNSYSDFFSDFTRVLFFFTTALGLFFVWEKIGCLLGLSGALVIVSGIVAFVWLPYNDDFSFQSLLFFGIGLFVSFFLIITFFFDKPDSGKDSNDPQNSGIDKRNNQSNVSFFDNNNSDNSSSSHDWSDNFKLDNDYDSKYKEDEYK